MSSSTTGDFVILCVCAGNIHRSALAEALLETWAGWYLPAEVAPHVRVHSAGLIAEPGMPIGSRARRIASALGADDRARTSTTLTDRLVEDADLVLTATRRQADEIVSRVPGALRSTFTMREAGRIAETFGNADGIGGGRSPEGLRTRVAEMADRRQRGAAHEDDIIDPQGEGDAVYVRMIRQEVPALAAIGAALFGMSAPDLHAYSRAAEDPAGLLDGVPGGSGRARS
jgi:protein-tyrosine phosphatase